METVTHGAVPTSFCIQMGNSVRQENSPLTVFVGMEVSPRNHPAMRSPDTRPWTLSILSDITLETPKLLGSTGKKWPFVLRAQVSINKMAVFQDTNNKEQRGVPRKPDVLLSTDDIPLLFMV